MGAYSFIIICCLAGFICLEGGMYLLRRRQRRAMQTKLELAKEETRDIAMLSLNNPQPIIQVSAAGEILFSNPAAIKLFPDLDARQLSHPVMEHIQACFRQLLPYRRDVYVNGRIYQQCISAAKIKNKDAFIIYMTDITSLKTYEADLEKSKKQAEENRVIAEQANMSRGQFLANMSHELRTPMNGIIGLSELLTKRDLAEDTKYMARAIHQSAAGLLVILNDILDFSKIEAGELRIERISFAPRDMIAQIEALHRAVAEEKGLAFHIKIAEDVPDMLSGDPARLQQILNNLLNNALKFTHSGHVSITVSVEDDPKGEGAFLNLSVEDSGIGIAKDKQAGVFEKFQQAEGSTARQYGGTGLGLSITRDLVELMQGVIGIESQMGEGTRFDIRIPTAVIQTEKMTQDQAEQVCDRGLNHGAKILVVDDHPVNLLYMKHALMEMGFSDPDEAESGVIALRLYQENAYDLIFMDCQMPDMDGFEATQKIRDYEVHSERKTPIIALTADAMKGAEEKCRKAGMDDYLSKPVARAGLVSILKQWLPPAANDQPVKIAALDEFTQGDAEMEQELLQIFLDNFQVDLSALHQAYQKQDFILWDEAAHKLYGACAHMGIATLADICNKAQSLETATPEVVKQLHFEILSESRRVRDQLAA